MEINKTICGKKNINYYIVDIFSIPEDSKEIIFLMEISKALKIEKNNCAYIRSLKIPSFYRKEKTKVIDSIISKYSMTSKNTHRESIIFYRPISILWMVYISD